jgi:alpha/beta superfamily hydrolase
MFGRPSRRLFGIFHPRTTATQSGAVLVCNPFGQEAIRAHRMFRVLAERLAQAGFDCLRFDYFGTGDSAGADEDGDLNGWVEDVRTAHGELQRRTQSSRLAWVGARLGGSIAVLCGARTRPVAAQGCTCGTDSSRAAVTWASCDSKHVESRKTRTASPTHHGGSAWPKIPAPFGRGHRLRISAALRRQLEQLNQSRLRFRDLEVHVVALPDEDSVNAWLLDLQSHGTKVHHWPLSHLFDWTAAEAMNTTLVPGPALNRIVASISD